MKQCDITDTYGQVMIEDLQYFCFIMYVRLCCLMRLSAATLAMTLGNPRAFAQQRLQIPLSKTKI